MTIYSHWSEVPELQRGEFLAINVTNDKPHSFEKNVRLFGLNQAGDWPVKNAVASRGLVGALVLLYFGPGPKRTLYFGTVLKARKEGLAGNNQMRYRFTVGDNWQEIGHSEKAFLTFFTGQPIGSGSVTHWVKANEATNIGNAAPTPGYEIHYMAPQRVGQDIFAESVSAYWGGRCALTGISTGVLLEACHIVPWADLDEERESRTNPDNGLFLCVHLHKLFDAYQLSFDDEGRLLIRRDLEPAVRRIVLAAEAHRLRIVPTEGQIDFLRRHRAAAQGHGADWEVCL